MEREVQGNSDWIETYGLDPDLIKDTIPRCDEDHCQNDAKYWVTTTCCNNALWYCREDLEIIYKSILRQSTEDRITCHHCNKRIPAKGSLSKPHKF